MKVSNRVARFGVDELFLNRWSPRAFSGESIEHTVLMKIFEAASWAPSSFNNQEWRFVYAHRETSAWQPLFDLLVDANKIWVKNCAVLVLVVSRDTFEKTGKPSRTHSLCTGSAWMAAALQTSLIDGLAAHGMSGFDFDRARTVCKIPEGYTVEMMFAIGKVADPSTLPEDLRRVEVPSQRKPVSEIISEGVFSLD